MKKLALLIAAVMSSAAWAGQAEAPLAAKYDILSNTPTEKCSAIGADWALCFKGKISLTSSGLTIPAGKSNFELFVPSPRRILALETDEWQVEAVTGDLHKLTPTDKFKGLSVGSTVEIPLLGEYWQIKNSDFFSGWFARQGERTIDVSSKGELNGNWFRTAGDKNVEMTVDSRYEAYPFSAGQQARADGRIIPAPVSQEIGTGTASIENGIFFNVSGNTGLGWQGENAVRQQIAQLGLANKNGKGLKLNTTVNPSALPDMVKKSGGYKLLITPTEVTVIGFDAKGAFYGVQSLLSLVNVNTKTPIPTMTVLDAPRYEYRGHMIDIARNFQSAKTIKAVIDEMAINKFSVLHLHLSDDEGWRLQIEGLPELTQVGGKRGADFKDGVLVENNKLLPQLGAGPQGSKTADGWLTRQQFVDLLTYAAARHIAIVPEIDMPGHSRAAVVAMEARYNKLAAQGDLQGAEQYRLLDPQDKTNMTTVQFYDRKSVVNPCVAGTERFTKKVMHEIANMYREAGVALPTWHMGGDEAKNIKLGGGFADKAGVVQPWQGAIDKAAEDAPWAKSPACDAYAAKNGIPRNGLPKHFVQQVGNWANEAGYPALQAWSDGLHDLSSANELPKGAVVNVWDTIFWGGTDVVSNWHSKGFKVVLSNPDALYLDMPNESAHDEPGYYWASRDSNIQKIFGFAPGNIAQYAAVSKDRDGNPYTVVTPAVQPVIQGISSHQWGETVSTSDRLGYMTFPRLYAVAERAWSKPEWERPFTPGAVFTFGQGVDLAAMNEDFERFSGAVASRAFARLDKLGLSYRVPTPGARIVNGKLDVRTALKGQTVEYRLPGGDWKRFEGPVSVNGPVDVRGVAGSGKTVTFTVR